jgi:allophanate hydrolase
LESQLIELGGRFLESTTTAPCYKLYELQTDPVKPGMKRAEEGGEAIEVDVYAIPVKQFGLFMKKIAPPLCMGTVLLADGEPVTGFLCEDYALITAKDITFKRKFSY